MGGEIYVVILKLPVSKLVEVGFEYVTEMDGLKIFRERK